MNKSLITNLLAAILTLAGYVLEIQVLFVGGLFALSGAMTNWIAIYMLFDKVPGFYGSGVVPLHFEEFKTGIRNLMMREFFTDENIDRFLNSKGSTGLIEQLEPVIRKVDLSPAYDTLVKTIMESSFGSMLGMLGGVQALEPLKQPFIDNMRESIVELTQTENFQSAMIETLEQPVILDEIRSNVEEIIDQRLEELTPSMIKTIVQDMIRKHLGWLVIWGAVFGGAIGVCGHIIGVI
ncbi:MAG: uncharacterized membrane protein YheB (UPF0754 family) [Gammaproteobacteria bacterium]|jgi:uncharacterized membrane protein YheB (UPF0754 family)